MAAQKFSKTAIDDILKAIAGLSTGRFKDRIESTDDLQLNSIIDAINKASEALKAQTHTHTDASFIVEALGIGIWKWDLVTNELNWDENMYRLYGIHASEFSGAYDAWEKSLSPETKAKAIDEINLAVAGKKEFDTTFQVVHKSTGRVQEIRTRAFVIRDDSGKPLKMWGLNIDRTREAQLEVELKAEQAKLVHSSKMASLGEMAGGVAHEINNPLAIIDGKVSQLRRMLDRDGLDTTKLKEGLDTIQATSDRVAKIVKGLRAFSRNAAADPMSAVPLRSVVQDSLALCSERFKSHSIDLRVSIRTEAIVECRAPEICQIVMNLLANAHDAAEQSQDKWVAVDVTSDHFHATVAVTDCGTGIPKHVVEKMMQPFFTTKDVGKGTGLGLSIAKGIADNHQGSLEYDSHSPHTRFVLRIPLVQSKLEKTAQ